MNETQLIGGWAVFLLCWAALFAVLWWRGEGIYRGCVALGWTLVGLALIYGLLHLAHHVS